MRSKAFTETLFPRDYAPLGRTTEKDTNMSVDTPRGEDDPLERLDRVKSAFVFAQKHLLKLLAAFSDADQDDPKTAEISAANTSYLKSLIALQTLEADLEKRGDIVRAQSGGQLDCAAARTEILARLARIRERT